MNIVTPESQTYSPKAALRVFLAGSHTSWRDSVITFLDENVSYQINVVNPYTDPFPTGNDLSVLRSFEVYSATIADIVVFWHPSGDDINKILPTDPALLLKSEQQQYSVVGADPGYTNYTQLQTTLSDNENPQTLHTTLNSLQTELLSVIDELETHTTNRSHPLTFRARPWTYAP